jgi:hypothetical protein
MGHQIIQLTVKRYGHLQPGANRHWMNKLPGLRRKQSQARSKNDKGRQVAASNRLILKAGHEIRTRDFDLGNIAVN